MLLLGFSFTFCHSCLVINTLGGCYEFHAQFLRAWGCDETGLEWLRARFFSVRPPVKSCWACARTFPAHIPVTLPPTQVTGRRGMPPRPLPLPHRPSTPALWHSAASRGSPNQRFGKMCPEEVLLLNITQQHRCKVW